MSVTTEEAELLARTHDLVRFTLGMKAPEHDLTAAALRSIAAERDALRAKVERPESGVSYETFVSAMQIVTVERDALQAEITRLRAELATALKDALEEAAWDLD
jgi:mRNA-degrading endonuclease toxin of MazEF toxin-antitoxin module